MLYAYDFESTPPEVIASRYGTAVEYVTALIRGQRCLAEVSAYRLWRNAQVVDDDLPGDPLQAVASEWSGRRYEDAKRLSESPLLRHLLRVRLAFSTPEARRRYVELAAEFLGVGLAFEDPPSEKPKPSVSKQPEPELLQVAVPTQVETLRSRMDRVFAETLRKNEGNLTRTAKVLGMDLKTARNWKNGRAPYRVRAFYSGVLGGIVDAAYAEALRLTDENTAASARLLGVDEKTVYNWRKRQPGEGRT